MYIYIYILNIHVCMCIYIYTYRCVKQTCAYMLNKHAGGQCSSTSSHRYLMSCHSSGRGGG